MRISDWSSDVCSSDLTAAGRDPASLPSVFASTHGDLPIMDYMCATLASEPRTISPTKFHNSVHNAAAGYWTIGSGCMHASTAVSAFDASFAQGLVERSEEHTSELQSLMRISYAVFCLKTKMRNHTLLVHSN